jgi:hypothetical protein
MAQIRKEFLQNISAQSVAGITRWNGQGKTMRKYADCSINPLKKAHKNETFIYFTPLIYLKLINLTE